MSSSRTQRLLGLLNHEILALPEDSPASAQPHPTDQTMADLTSALYLQDLSYKPDSGNKQRSTSLCRGDLAPWKEAYVSVKAASKFPYTFLGGAHADQVAKRFFDRNQFWARGWDLYYIWPTADIARGPLVLINIKQFQLLIEDINKYKRNINCRLTAEHHNRGLIINIPHPEFAPRFLGYCASRTEYDDLLQRRMPAAYYHAPGEPVRPTADKLTREAFETTINNAFRSNRANRQGPRGKTGESPASHRQDWGGLLRRTQRYLGLRPDSSNGYNPLEDPALSWAELQAAQATHKLRRVEVESRAPFPFEKSVIFISVDIEAFELDNSKITEVGVATLDVLDIVSIAPGQDGRNWYDKIRARHFLIHEHRHLENSRHVTGCAANFEFGKSEIVRLAEVPSTVATCFRPPYSAQGSPDQQTGTSAANADGTRNLVFVGHDPNQDIMYLQRLGYTPTNLSNLIEIVDTKLLHQHWKRGQQGTSLGRVLADLDIVGWNLHNGGNDAVYTMQAMLALGVREAALRDSNKEARMDATNEAEDWSHVNEDVDGGVTVQ